eukprot:gene3583-8628_t
MLSGVDLRVLHCVLDRRLRARAFQRHRGRDSVLAAFAGAVAAAGDGQPLHALLVDLSKCYDVVSHQCMAAIFREMGMPPCFSDHGDAQQGDAQQGDAQQGDAQQGDAQQGDAQQGDAQQGDAQQGDAQQGDAQQGDAQQGDAQQGDAQQGDAQQGDAQQGDAQQGD